MSTPPKITWTEALVIDALRETYLPALDRLNNEEWAFLTQVMLRCPGRGHEERVAAGLGPSAWTMNERKMDVFLVRNWVGGKHGHERIAVEVKVSKADYRNETPEKRAPAEASAHRCAYAAPAGLIDPDTLPDGWGLIEIHAIQFEGMSEPRFEAKWCRKATRRVPTTDESYLVSAGFRRASRAEERIRRGESDAAEVVRLRAENETLRGVAERAQEARDREMGRAKSARNELLALTGAQNCSTCDAALTWKRGGRADSRWQHKDESVERACSDLRRAAYAAARATGASVEYPYDPVPDMTAAAPPYLT